MTDVVLQTALAYLLGTLMGGQIIGWLRGGVDLRKQGSGNLGATNALRTQGVKFALAVLLIDVLKGVVASTLVPLLPTIDAPIVSRENQAYLCGVAVALGHCYPVSAGFKGGKGVATLAGVFGALMPLSLLLMLPVFVLTVIATGYVSLATIAATSMALFYVACVGSAGLLSPAGAFTGAMAALVVFKHRENLVRLARGTENRFEKAMVWRKWRKH
ncbi:glycerol-3-phosphate 1-O-acyltransferase PlsY [Sinimarinibacterium sp. NLF-5-8]|uniref:glycerol-3-phosphate 1-O-acyltransferase PlsY n=1 Tax=Sinimarinibacterium sp. NLF-5-8 TaxID=2698684 RepID=UPI00137BE5E9|nr:glycerol-3-phosphate 1-O-acyltransferase PlsY [Sinimarinibacterium sp. NLF-5-8]QHS10487.1 glycerol-3-phosphate 1-O-acyltransferase PlsY [Sinimarinibacterium sp. NLF-5-8]